MTALAEALARVGEIKAVVSRIPACPSSRSPGVEDVCFEYVPLLVAALEEAEKSEYTSRRLADELSQAIARAEAAEEREREVYSQFKLAESRQAQSEAEVARLRGEIEAVQELAHRWGHVYEHEVDAALSAARPKGDDDGGE